MIQQSHFQEFNQKLGSQRNIYTPMFIAAQFTMAKIWNQPKCLSAYEWIQEMWHKHTVEHYSTTGNEILPFIATWIQLETAILSKAGQKEKDKYL